MKNSIIKLGRRFSLYESKDVVTFDDEFMSVDVRDIPFPDIILQNMKFWIPAMLMRKKQNFENDVPVYEITMPVNGSIEETVVCFIEALRSSIRTLNNRLEVSFQVRQYGNTGTASLFTYDPGKRSELRLIDLNYIQGEMKDDCVKEEVNTSMFTGDITNYNPSDSTKAYIHLEGFKDPSEIADRASKVLNNYLDGNEYEPDEYYIVGFLTSQIGREPPSMGLRSSGLRITIGTDELVLVIEYIKKFFENYCVVSNITFDYNALNNFIFVEVASKYKLVAELEHYFFDVIEDITKRKHIESDINIGSDVVPVSISRSISVPNKITFTTLLRHYELFYIHKDDISKAEEIVRMHDPSVIMDNTKTEYFKESILFMILSNSIDNDKAGGIIDTLKNLSKEDLDISKLDRFFIRPTYVTFHDMTSPDHIPNHEVFRVNVSPSDLDREKFMCYIRQKFPYVEDPWDADRYMGVTGNGEWYEKDGDLYLNISCKAIGLHNDFEKMIKEFVSHCENYAVLSKIATDISEMAKQHTYSFGDMVDEDPILKLSYVETENECHLFMKYMKHKSKEFVENCAKSIVDSTGKNTRVFEVPEYVIDTLNNSSQITIQTIDIDVKKNEE